VCDWVQSGSGAKARTHEAGVCVCVCVYVCVLMCVCARACARVCALTGLGMLPGKQGYHVSWSASRLKPSSQAATPGENNGQSRVIPLRLPFAS